MSVSMVSLTECVTFRSDVFLNSKPLQRAACLRLASGIPASNPGPPFMPPSSGIYLKRNSQSIREMFCMWPALSVDSGTGVGPVL